MTRIALALGILFTSAGLTLSLAPDSSGATTAGAVHSAVALPAGRGGGSGGEGSAGGSSGGGSGGGHSDGGQQYNVTVASVDNYARRERHRPVRREHMWDGCGGGYYDRSYGCYQPQA